MYDRKIIKSLHLTSTSHGIINMIRCLYCMKNYYFAIMRRAMMEFNEKLQQLRKHNQMTQEQLAEKLYVSRTAISKWESGKGYPNIESLKSIAELFSVSIDDLLSSDELIVLAETENRSNIDRLYNCIYWIIDILMPVLIFMPLYGERDSTGFIRSVPLLSNGDLPTITRIFYITPLVLMALFGAIEIIIERRNKDNEQQKATFYSLAIHVFAIIAFSMSQQPYVIFLIFILFLIKIIVLFKKMHK